MNHRCPKRIVDLLNKVRDPVDTHKQRPRSDAAGGTVRLFITEANHPDTFAFEDDVARTMAHLTDDALWTSPDEVKTLTLEHRMAARRLGCPDVFGALYELDNQSLLNGTMGVANFFTAQVLPIVEAKRDSDRFGLMRVVKSYSPLMSTEAMRASPGRASLEAVQAAVDSLYSLFADGGDPTLLEALREIAKTGLLEVPERLVAWILLPDDDEPEERDGEQEGAAARQRIEAIDRLLSAPFSQIAPLRDYLGKRTRFDTHQGVKGLEFERVMVIMDDHEARGFSFKYGDLFGKKADGKVLEATRRLFYVVTSRAKKSLALIAYTDAPARVRDFALQSGWFTEVEVIVR